MKLKKKTILILIPLFLLITATSSFADEAKERIYLVQILNQLDAVQPIILAAAKEQPKNIRIQFHYTRYTDAKGQVHNGLLEDIQAIRAGIEQKLNQTSVEPRVVQPIKGDYFLSPSNGATLP